MPWIINTSPDSSVIFDQKTGKLYSKEGDFIARFWEDAKDPKKIFISLGMDSDFTTTDGEIKASGFDGEENHMGTTVWFMDERTGKIKYKNWWSLRHFQKVPQGPEITIEVKYINFVIPGPVLKEKKAVKKPAYLRLFAGFKNRLLGISANI